MTHTECCRAVTATAAPYYPEYEIRFGGDTHWDDIVKNRNTGEVDMLVWSRPEQTRSYACVEKENCAERDSPGWRSCADETLCFHGCRDTEEDKETSVPLDRRCMLTGDAAEMEHEGMRLDVPEDSSFSKFAFSGKVRCADTNRDSFIKIASYGIRNGNISFWKDGDMFYNHSSMEQFTTHTDDLSDKNVRNNVSGGSVIIPLTKGIDHDIRVEFELNDSKENAWAQTYVEVLNVDESMDRCSTRKFCRDVLASSSTGFTIVNSNSFEYMCLKETPCVVGEWDIPCEDFEDLCTTWKSCMNAAAPQESHWLLVLLEAAGVDESGKLTSLLQAESGSAASQTRTSTCFHPVKDPGMIEVCNCAETVQEECQVSGGDLVECTKAKMCNSPHICEDWKNDHCAPSILAEIGSSVSADRALLARRSSVGSEAEQDLDLDRSAIAKTNGCSAR
jgi:hypothetical protein